jgi:O-acetyl-ADP-ribose deacetylase (regulator of RNase III)
VWNGGAGGEPELLASCYARALSLAESVGAESIAFPAISTGVYRYPIEDATRTAIVTACRHLDASELPEKVVFCCFSASDAEAYERIAGELLGR